MKATELFETALPTALANNADAAKTVNAKFQFNVAGAGSWHLDLTQTGPLCKQGQDAADVTFSISDDNFEKLLANPEGQAMSMFFTGKLKMSGNQSTALKLSKVLTLVKK